MFLIGENNGNVNFQNGMAMWEVLLEKKTSYLVANEQFFKTATYADLTSDQKKYVVLRNSEKHEAMYKQADMLLCTLSYHDVVPVSVLVNDIDKPIIYLGHGKLALKSLYYNGNSYNGNIFRFMYYNPAVHQKLLDRNFEEHQLKFGKFPPNYKYLYEKTKQYEQKKDRLLAFITWREAENGYEIINGLIEQYLELNEEYDVKIVIHNFIDKEKLCTDQVVHSNEVDLHVEMIEASYFITDYSSVIWDAAYIGRKVFLMQPDFKEYYSERECYEPQSKFSNIAANNIDELKVLLESDYPEDNYFTTNTCTDYELIDQELNSLADYLIEKIENKYSFVGFRFRGIGGTILATKSLAQGLIKAGHLVEFISLVDGGRDKHLIPGLIHRAVYHGANPNKVMNLKIMEQEPSEDLLDDYTFNIRSMNAYTEHLFKKMLRESTAKFTFSTRETFHRIIAENSSSPYKGYIFHTDVDFALEHSPNLFDKLNSFEMENKFFVSESLREKYSEYIDVNNSELLPNSVLEMPIAKKGKMMDYQITVNNVSFTNNCLQVYAGLRDLNNYQLSEDLNSFEIMVNNNHILATKVITSNPRKFEIQFSVPQELLKQNNTFDFSFKYFDVEQIFEFIYPEDKFLNTTYSIVEFNQEEEVMTIEICGISAEKLNAEEVNLINYGLVGYQLEVDSKSIEVGQNYVYNPIGLDSPIIVDKLNGNKIEINKFMPALDVNANRKTVAAILRISENRTQHLDELIAFAKYLKASKSDIFVKVYGSGNVLADYRELVISEEIQSHIAFVGERTNVREAIRDIDTVISFSAQESFGMVYIEAILFGKRLFTTINSGSQSLFVDNGFEEVIAHDFDEMKAKIENEDDKDLFENIYNCFEEKYSATAVSDNLVKTVNGGDLC